MGYDVKKIKQIYAIAKDVKKTAEIYNRGRARKNRISRNKTASIVKGVSTKPRLLPGIVLFSVFIIITSLSQMYIVFTHTDEYISRYGYLPHWLFLCRYAFSWIQRIIGISFSVGLLYRKELFRKLFVCFAVFIMLTVPWKHPYNKILDKKVSLIEDRVISSQLKTFSKPHAFFLKIYMGSMSIIWLTELLFWYFVLKYLTSARVRKLYKNAKVAGSASP